MKKKIIFVTISIICMSTTLVLAWATANLLSWWMVDSGGHLDWSGSTTFSSQFNSAVNTWNNYKSGVIRKDTILTVNDVTIKDVGYISQDVYARTTAEKPSGKTTGEIKFATSLLNGASNSLKKAVIIHELGHALGLDHYTGDTKSVMYPIASESICNTTLTAYDKQAYDASADRY